METYPQIDARSLYPVSVALWGIEAENRDHEANFTGWYFERGGYRQGPTAITATRSGSAGARARVPSARYQSTEVTAMAQGRCRVLAGKGISKE